MSNPSLLLKPPIDDTMGEVFTAQDFECLAYNIQRKVDARTRSGPLRVVELGTWSGQSTLAIARPHVLVHSLSSWNQTDDPRKVQWLADERSKEDSPLVVNLAFQQFVTNTKGFVFRTVMPLICHPLDAVSWWPEKLDAIFVNGDTCDIILRHVISEWSKHVRSGGTIYGVYKDHTVAALTGLGHYTVDGTIWRHRVAKECGYAMGKEVSQRRDG